MPILLFPGGGATVAPTIRGYYNTIEVLDRIPPALACEGYSSMLFCTQADLIEWSNNAIEDLTRTTGVNVETDDSITTVAAQADYTLPTGHLSTIDADLEGAKLRPASGAELAALNQDWTTTTGTPTRYTEGEGFGEVRLYPIPTANGDTLRLVFHRKPADVSTSAPYVGLPSILQDYQFHRVFSLARRKESQSQMQDAADFSDKVAELIQQTAQAIWGGPQ